MPNFWLKLYKIWNKACHHSSCVNHTTKIASVLHHSVSVIISPQNWSCHETSKTEVPHHSSYHTTKIKVCLSSHYKKFKVWHLSSSVIYHTTKNPEVWQIRSVRLQPPPQRKHILFSAQFVQLQLLAKLPLNKTRTNKKQAQMIDIGRYAECPDQSHENIDVLVCNIR